MLDGAALITGAEVVQDQGTQDTHLPNVNADVEPETFSDPFTNSVDLLSALSTTTAPSDRKEIVFIDTSVDDFQALMEGIDPNAEVLLLDSTRDGIEQIAEILSERRDIDAIHIISHGNQGELRLGSGILNLASMQGEYADELAIINQALSEEADFLIYGCNFGEGELGQEAASLLAELTGADIAASDDLTGSTQLGGDWDLEVSTGTLETSVAVSLQAQQNWHGLLVPLVDTGEFVANDLSGNDEQTSGRARGANRAVDIASNGDYVVVWTDETTSNAVHAKVFDKDGNEKVSEFQVSIGGIDNHWANVAMDDSGNFVVTWTQLDEVFMRRFQADGTAIDAGAVQVNTLTTNFQQNPSVSMNGGGDFVIAWETEVGGNAGIFVRQGTFAGGLIGSDITVDAGTGLANASVDINNSGKFVVVWQKGNEPHAQRFAADGTARGPAIDINLATSVLEQHAVVAVQSLGDFVVAYRSEFPGFQGVWMKRYLDDGTEASVASKVSSGSSHLAPSISVDSSDNYIIVYEGDGDGSGKGVFGRKYDSGGTAQGAQFQINETTLNGQDRASVAMSDLNNFVAVWTGSDGAQTDVFARQFGSITNTAPIITSNGGGATAAVNAAENQTTVTTVMAMDADLPPDMLTFSKNGGADAALFNLDSGTGVLTFNGARDFETFTDANSDGVYEVTVQVADGNGGIDTQDISVTVTNISPTILSTTGGATVTSGVSYTLNLSANEDVTSWTINWGDGTIDTIVGNPPSVAHTYTNSGLTFNILAAATDVDGTYLQNELLVPRYIVDSVDRFEETTGAFLQQFAPQSGGLDDPIQTIIGPDGNLYVTGERSDNVVRYNPITGAKIDEFVTGNSGGLNSPGGLTFGPDGNLYVASFITDEVLRFDGTTGAFIDAFATGVNRAYGVTFGPDGNLYVNTWDDTVLKFDGTTGAPLGTFVAPSAGGLDRPERMVFGPDGHLYIASSGSDEVLRYNGTTGAFINAFVTAGLGGLNSPGGIDFGPDGNLYVSGQISDNILRYNGTTGAFLGEYVSAATGLDRPSMFTFLPELQVLVTDGSPPVNTVPATATVAEDMALPMTGSNLITVTDVDGNLSTVQLAVTQGRVTVALSGGASISGGGSGTSTLTLSGTQTDINATLASLTYQGNPHYNGPDTLTVTSTDSNSVTDVDMVDITVTAVNDVPVATGNTVIAQEDVPLVIDSTDFLFTDIEGDGLVSVTITGLTLNGGTLTHSAGAVTVTNGMPVTLAELADLTFTSALHDSTNSSFTYTVNDAGLGVTSATMNITVNAVNDVPVATGNTVIAQEDVPLVIDSTDFLFTDIEGDSLVSVTITGLTLNGGTLTHSAGAVTVTNGMPVTLAELADLTFTSALHDSTNSSFTYTVNDAGLGVTSATMNITVNAVNDAPIITNLGGDTLPYVTASGALVIDQSMAAAVSDVDSANFDTGILTVAFTAGNDNTEDELGIQHVGTNPGEIGVSGGNVTYEGVTIGTFTGGGSGGGALVVTLNTLADTTAVSALVQNITYENTDLASPTIGARTVSFTITDGDGGTSLTSDTTINVSAQVAPVITNLGGDTLAYTEGDVAAVIEQGGNAAVSDVDSANFDTGTLTVAFTAGNDNAEDELGIQNVGTNLGEIGVSGGNVTYEGVTIGTFTGGGSGGGALVVTLNTLADTTAVSALVQNITYENTDTDNPTTSARTVQYVLTDGDGGTSLNYDTTVTVAAVNDVPVATGNTVVAQEDVPLVIDSTDFFFTDIEGDSLVSVTITGLNLNGGTLTHTGGTVPVTNGMTVMLAELSDLTFTSAFNDSTNSSFTYTVNDTDLGVTSATLNITVNAVNDVPVNTVPPTATVAENTALAMTGPNLISVTDVDGNLASTQLTVTQGFVTVTLSGGATISAGTNGMSTMTISGTETDINATLASLIYQGTLNYNGPDTLTTLSTDSAGTPLSDIDVTTITVTAVNTPPVAMPDSFTINEGSINTLDLANNDSDPDDGLDLTSITIVAGPTNGTITSINTDGTVEYTHNGSETLTDDFTYTINDLGGNTSNSVTVSLTVTPQNDAPSITSDGGGANASVSVLTGNISVTMVTASDAEGGALTYSIAGGADAALFQIDSTTGVLTFKTAPNIQTPTDVGGDNVYEVIVQASDGTLVDTQALAVTIADIPVVVLPPPPEPPPESPPSSEEGDSDEDFSPIGGTTTPPTHGNSSGTVQDSTPGNPQNTDSLQKPTADNLALLEQLNARKNLDGTASDLLGLLGNPLEFSAFKSEIESLLGTSSGFLKGLDQIRDAFEGVSETEQTYLASSVAASTGLSVGYVFWLLRSGVLLTALLSTVPAWQFVNPLLVLDTPAKRKWKNGQDDLEDDSVESLFDQQTETPETSQPKTEIESHTDETHQPQEPLR